MTKCLAVVLALAFAGCQPAAHGPAARASLHSAVAPTREPFAGCPPGGSAVRCSPDVLVAGGGLAAIAAARAAAVQGLHVTLVAPEPYLGGIVTAAMMDQWDFNIIAGGASVQGGLFPQMYAALGDSFTGARAKQYFAALTAAAHVDVLTGMRVTSVATRRTFAGRAVTALALRDAGGRRRRFAARCIIDATDDADVAALAGARYGIGRQDQGRDTKMQAATLLFTLAGVDWSRLTATYDTARYGYGRAIGTRAWGYGRIVRGYRPRSPRVTVRDLNLILHPNGGVGVNAINVFGVDGRDPRSVAQGTALAKAEAPAFVAYLRTRIAGLERARVATYADALYVRETRHILGRRLLREGDVWNRRVPPDTIGLASYPLDVHPVEPSDTQKYAPERRVYGIPLAALLPRGFTNLGVAGRAISATHVAAGSARILPTTVEEGEALGTACAIARARRVDLVTVDERPGLIAALRADLRAHGTLLEPPG